MRVFLVECMHFKLCSQFSDKVYKNAHIHEVAIRSLIFKNYATAVFVNFLREAEICLLK